MPPKTRAETTTKTNNEKKETPINLLKLHKER
jgi:hypothetical protein